MNKHYQKVGAFCPPFSSSDEETWTPDRRITNTLLYQLSYIGKNCEERSISAQVDKNFTDAWSN